MGVAWWGENHSHDRHSDNDDDENDDANSNDDDYITDSGFCVCLDSQLQHVVCICSASTAASTAVLRICNMAECLCQSYLTMARDLLLISAYHLWCL